MCVCVRAQKAAVLANERLSNVLEVFDEGWNEFLLTAIVKNVDPDVHMTHGFTLTQINQV